MIDQNRLTRQRKGAERWRHSDQYGATKPGSGTIQWVGGVGKTFAAVHLIIKPYLKHRDDNKVTVLLPRNELIKQWEKEIDERIDLMDHDRIQILSVHTLQAQRVKITTGLLVADEIHLMYGDKLIKYLDGTHIKFRFNLGLTATYKDRHNAYKKIEHMWPVVDRITAKEAIENNWISSFFEYNWGIQLPSHDVDEYMRITNEMDRIFDKMDADFDLLSNMNAGKKDMFGGYVPPMAIASRYAKDQGWFAGCSPNVDRMWNPSVLVDEAKKYFMLIHARKKLLNEHPLKVEKAIEVIEKFKSLRIISFSESTIFADMLAAELKRQNHPVVVYHSSLESRNMVDENGQIIVYKSGKKKGKPKIFGKTTLKRLAVEKIRSGDVKVISTASALDEGFDVKSIRIGLITSRNSNKNKQHQRGYRATRVDPFNPDAQCAIVNIYFVQTQDEKWLNRSQKDTDNTVKWIQDADEIGISDKEGFDI